VFRQLVARIARRSLHHELSELAVYGESPDGASAPTNADFAPSVRILRCEWLEFAIASELLHGVRPAELGDVCVVTRRSIELIARVERPQHDECFEWPRHPPIKAWW